MSKAPKEARRKAGKEKPDVLEGLPPLNLNAAGIDVGNAEHTVAVPPGRDARGSVLAVSRPTCIAWGNG
jgi:hypothetical protein